MPPLHWVLALLVILIWGFNFVVIKIGLNEIPPLLLACARFFLTSIPAVFFIKRPPVPFGDVIWYGLITFALQFGLLFLGMSAGVDPGLASILLQTHVFFTTLLGILIFKETLHIWQIIGACMSFAGIAIVGLNVGGSLTGLGFCLVIASAISWGVGNVLSKKIGKVDMAALVIWGSFIGWPLLLLASIFIDGPDKILSAFEQLSSIGVGAVLYITYLSTLFGFGVWSWLIHHHPLGKIAPLTLMVPILALLSSSLVLGEPLQSWKILACVLVIGGLCVNLFGKRINDLF